MKYRVEFIEKSKVVISKEFQEYDEAYNYSNELIKKLDVNSEIIILEKKNNDWKVFRKLNVQ